MSRGSAFKTPVKIGIAWRQIWEEDLYETNRAGLVTDLAIGVTGVWTDCPALVLRIGVLFIAGALFLEQGAEH
jgi:hypothetical protein